MSQNSSHRFDQPLQVELGTSRLLPAVALLFYLPATLCCAWLPWHGAWRIAVCGLLLAHFLHIYRLHVVASLPRAVCALDWNARRGWRIRGPDGDWQKVTLCLPVLVSYRLAVARFRSGGWLARCAVIVSDRLSADEFRRVRVRLIQSAHGDRDRTKIPGQG